MIQCDISVKIDRASFPDDNNIWTFLFLHAFRTGIKGFTIHSYSGLPKTRTNNNTYYINISKEYLRITL